MLLGTAGNAVGAVVAAVLVVGSFAVIGLVLTIRQRRRRAADMGERLTEMATWAQARGWVFAAEDPAVAAGMVPGCFQLEHPAPARQVRARDVAVGKLGYPSSLPVQVAEWDRSRYAQTVAADGARFTTTVHDFCATARVNLPTEAPTVAVVPRGPERSKKSDEQSAGERVTGDAAFDGAFRVVAPDPSAMTMLTPQVVQWQNRQVAGTGWQITGATLEIWASGHLSAAVADDLIAEATSLLQLLPLG